MNLEIWSEGRRSPRDDTAGEGRERPALGIDCAKIGIEEEAVDMHATVDTDLLPGLVPTAHRPRGR